jgi:hypothetical protein
MATFYAIGLWLVVGLGALSGVTALVIFLSCRCFPAWKPASKLMSNEKYRKFFKTHCNIWWAFGALVVIHAIVAILYLFSPF